MNLICGDAIVIAFSWSLHINFCAPYAEIRLKINMNDRYYFIVIHAETIVTFLTQPEYFSFYLHMVAFLALSVSICLSLSLCHSLSVSRYLFSTFQSLLGLPLPFLNSLYLPSYPFADRYNWSLRFLLYYSFFRMLGTRYWVDAIKLQSVQCSHCWEPKVKTKTLPIMASFLVTKHVIPAIYCFCAYVNLLCWYVSQIDSLIDIYKYFFPLHFRWKPH